MPRVPQVEIRRSLGAGAFGLAAALDQAADAVVMVAPGGRITFANQELLRRSGFAAADLLGAEITVLLGPVKPASALHAALDAGSAWSGAHLTRRADGGTFDTEWSLTPVTDADGQPAGMLAIARDRGREQVLEAQVARIARLEALGQLSAGIAHDFNNLLAAIAGYTDFVRAPMPLDDPARRDLDQVMAAADRGTRLVRQLMTFGRRQPTHAEVVDVNDVVAQISPMLHRLLGEHISLEARLAPDLGRTMADPGQVEQVVLNLATNARDAMPAGGRLTIETADVVLDDEYARQHAGVVPGDYVLLAVSDTGTGMDAATLTHMFEPFFTTKGVDRGTGLGLATVHGIVARFGGHVWAYSEVGQGTSFKVYLPRIEAEVPVGVLPGSVGRDATNGTETVLLVEDEASIRALLVRVLEQAGYTVLAASDGHGALALVQGAGRPIDVLVTDMVMPGISGPEVAAILLDRMPALRVLCMSGYAEQSATYQGLGGAVSDFIAKPFVADDLLRRLRGLLDAPAH